MAKNIDKIINKVKILTLRAPELKWKLVGNGGEHGEDD
jgi:hypothetical protein